MAEKVVLITGAGSGIGRATVESFQAAGWHVYATDVDDESLEDFDEEVSTAPLDVTDSEAVSRVVGRMETEAGGIDCVVNNAGYAAVGPVVDLESRTVRDQFDVLVYGPHDVIRQSRCLVERRSGTVVNVTSVLGRVVFPGAGAYCAGKFAMEALTDALRMETADVDVVAVEPAWVDTGFASDAGDRLQDLDRGAADDWVYDLYEDGGVLDGGPLAVSPEDVARTIVRVATTDDPKARYPVGWVARAVVASRVLPDRVLDHVRPMLGRAIARL